MVQVRNRGVTREGSSGLRMRKKKKEKRTFLMRLLVFGTGDLAIRPAQHTSHIPGSCLCQPSGQSDKGCSEEGVSASGCIHHVDIRCIVGARQGLFGEVGNQDQRHAKCQSNHKVTGFWGFMTISGHQIRCCSHGFFRVSYPTCVLKLRIPRSPVRRLQGLLPPVPK